MTPEEKLLNDVFTVLRKSDKFYEGYTYSLTTNNSKHKLIQSTYGNKDSQLLDAILERFQTLVIQEPKKPHYIDILQLGNDNSNDDFQEELIKSIFQMAKQEKTKIIIRYLEGNTGTTPVSNCFTFIDRIKNEYKGMVSNVFFYAATFNVPWVRDIFHLETPGSWNHAKIIAVDGVSSIVGGQNYWNDYLSQYPPYDVSIQVSGDVAAQSHQFANFLWEYVKDYSGATTSHKALQLGKLDFDQTLPPEFSSTDFPTPKQPDAIPVLTVGNLGIWRSTEERTLSEELAYSLLREQVSPKNTYPVYEKANNPQLWFPFSSFDYAGAKALEASTCARRLLLQKVQKNGHLRISQQKIANTDITEATGIVIWPGEFLEDIVTAMKDQNAKVDILLSNHAAGSNPVGGYSDDMGGKALEGVIIDLMTKAMNSDAKKAQALVADKLTIRQMPSGKSNHAKVWIVDNSVFYVGSDNAYPAYLQEYGFIIGHKAETDRFIQDYWEVIWKIGVKPE